jgi:hypothetical protein
MASAKLEDYKKKQNRWVKEYDPQSKGYYYYHTEEHYSVWDQPTDFVEGGSDERMKAVLLIQCSYRSRQSRRLVSVLKSKDYGELNITMATHALTNTVPAEIGWIEQYDPSSKHAYFYHMESGDCTWEKPAGFVPGTQSDKDTAIAVAKIQALFNGHQMRNDMQTKLDAFIAKKNKWVKEYDPESKAYYYYHAAERYSVWEEPDDFIEGGDNAEMKSVLLIQCSFRAKVARRKTKVQQRAHEDTAFVPETKGDTCGGRQKRHSIVKMFQDQSQLIQVTIDTIEDEVYLDMRQFHGCFEESRPIWRRYNVGEGKNNCDTHTVPRSPPGLHQLEELREQMVGVHQKVEALDALQKGTADALQIMVAEIKSKMEFMAASVDKKVQSLLEWSWKWVDEMSEFYRDVFGRMDILKPHLNVEFTPSNNKTDEYWLCPRSVEEIDGSFKQSLECLDALHNWLDTYRNGHVVVGTSTEAETIGSDTDIFLFTFLPIFHTAIHASKDAHDLLMGGDERLQFCLDSQYFEQKFKTMPTVKKRNVIEKQRQEFIDLCRRSWEVGLQMKIRDNVSLRRNEPSVQIDPGMKLNGEIEPKIVPVRRAATFRKKTEVVFEIFVNKQRVVKSNFRGLQLQIQELMCQQPLHCKLLV